MLVGKDKDDPKLRHLATIKNSLLPEDEKPGNICFELTRENGLRFIGKSAVTTDDLLQKPESKSGLKEQGITVLMMVAAFPGITAKEFSDQTGWNYSTAKNTMYRMAKQGLIENRLGHYYPINAQPELPKVTPIPVSTNGHHVEPNPLTDDFEPVAIKSGQGNLW